jgi:hypothetical protein
MQKNLFYLFACIALVQTTQGSWLAPSTQHLTHSDQALYSAVEAGDTGAAFLALQKGANPNAQINSLTIFIHAFEHALNRDWQGANKVTGVDEHRANVAYQLAQHGGNIKDLDHHVATHYGITAFKNNSASRVFHAFVQKLKAEATKY